MKLLLKIFIKAVVFLCFYRAEAQYITPGTGVSWNLDSLVLYSGGTVIENDGIYFITTNLTVSSPDTVKIDSNATVQIYPDVLNTIEGVLLTSPPDEVLFTAYDTTDTYLGFKFDETNASQVKNATFEYGGGIQLLYSDMLFENCIIRYNSSDNTSGAINMLHSDAVIKYCEIHHNENAAIASAANASSSPQILYNTIYSNTTDNSNRPQINLGSGSEDTLRIIGNTITGYYNNVGGISVATLAGGNIYCIIDRNVVQNNRYGLNVQGNNITSRISNNRFINNNLETNPMNGGSGISFYGGESNTSMVYKNTIRGNLWGVTIIYDALPNFGQLGEDTVNIGENIIHGNGNSGEIYDLYNNTANSIMAENNYWGTNDPDTVEMHIFHQPDDASLGVVDFEPIAIIEELSDEKEITAFSFEEFNPPVIGTIDQDDKTILLEVPFGSTINNLVATFTHSPEAMVFVGETEQESGATANDFTSDVVYTVVAEDNSEANYTVHVDIAPNVVKGVADKEQFEIYPNPADHNVIIEAKNSKIDHIEVINLYGQKVLSDNFQNLTERFVIDLSGISSGIYYLQIFSGDNMYNQKFIKK